MEAESFLFIYLFLNVLHQGRPRSFLCTCSAASLERKGTGKGLVKTKSKKHGVTKAEFCDELHASFKNTSIPFSTFMRVAAELHTGSLTSLAISHSAWHLTHIFAPGAKIECPLQITLLFVCFYPSPQRSVLL